MEKGKNRRKKEKMEEKWKQIRRKVESEEDVMRRKYMADGKNVLATALVVVVFAVCGCGSGEGDAVGQDVMEGMMEDVGGVLDSEVISMNEEENGREEVEQEGIGDVGERESEEGSQGQREEVGEEETVNGTVEEVGEGSFVLCLLEVIDEGNGLVMVGNDPEGKRVPVNYTGDTVFTQRITMDGVTGTVQPGTREDIRVGALVYVVGVWSGEIFQAGEVEVFVDGRK